MATSPGLRQAREMIVLQQYESVSGPLCAGVLLGRGEESCVPGCRPQEPPLDLFRMAIQGEFPRGAQPAFDEAPAQVWIRGELLNGKSQAICISRCKTQAVDLIEAILARPPDAGRNDGAPTGHGFQGHEPDGFVLDHAGKERYVGLLVVCAYLLPGGQGER